MKALKFLGIALALLIATALCFAGWHIFQRQPERSGVKNLTKLSAPVTVNYDERGVPHIQAGNEADLYRALGYVHAQDRLFQMEMVRRLAKGELAEILGPQLLDTDKMFRTLGIRQRAEEYVASANVNAPAYQALIAYLDGVNQYQNSHPAPLEFSVLGIRAQPFTPQDTIAVAGYLAYSFAAAFRTEPAMTFIREKLGADHLRAFDIQWHPDGVLAPVSTLNNNTWKSLDRLAQVSQSAMDLAGVPLLEGSNAWAISGGRTASGKPLLAGDPHIGFSAPSVWYEAHLSAPGFELYGHHQALNPVALLGHNAEFGWSLTMFQNDDIDLIAEKVNPSNPEQVWHQGQWVDMKTRTETIKVKGAPDVQLTLRRSPHGPIITDAFKDSLGSEPVAMWWAFLETPNPVIDAFYELNRANTIDKARSAASKIHAPGLNVVWANASGNIGWWAAAKLPRRPAGVNPTFILDAGKGEAEKPGFYPFSANPQEENPPRGYIVSANFQPQASQGNGEPVPGYYNLPDRGRRLQEVLSPPSTRWNTANAQALQLETGNDYGPRILKHVLPVLHEVVREATGKALLQQLEKWDGRYQLDSVAGTVFSQLTYEIVKAAMRDELGEVQFGNLLKTRALDSALPLLVADAASPWWDDRLTPARESRADTLRLAWSNTLKHLASLYGEDSEKWTWGKAHTVTHGHPLGRQKPLNLLFNVGPFAAPGGRETPNNLSNAIGPAPWEVSYGPSTRRVIDFADAGKAVGINPVGQSGVLFDKHYADQSVRYSQGQYVPQHLSAADVKTNTASSLTLQPVR